MATEAGIKAAIEAMVATRGTGYGVWTVGVTDNHDKRKGEHGNPPRFVAWNADTEQIARNVEAYFIAKGMKGGVGGLGRANYAYIF